MSTPRALAGRWAAFLRAARRFGLGTSPIRPRGALALASSVLVGVVLTGTTILAMRSAYYVYADRQDLPDVEPFLRFEFPTIGHVYDRAGQPLIELAREYRHNTPFADIPPIVREAILAAEDKHFFTHNGVDYRSLPRVLAKVRLRAWARRLATGGQRDNTPGPAIFPQGGSTITQQLVRGVFLQGQTALENSYELRNPGWLSRALSSAIGARNANMVVRKREEIRLALWLEDRMRERFGTKQRAKEEILARYVSFVYMGSGQYGFARASRHYFGQSLSTLTADDADKAAVLASIAKAPRDYAPSAHDADRVLRRRNQTLALMAARGSVSRDDLERFRQRRLPALASRTAPAVVASAVVAHVLDELEERGELGLDDLLQGRIQVHSTVDARVQRLAYDALQHGLEKYEARHPGVEGLTQGSVVVLSNRDGAVLAEIGGRAQFQGRSSSYSDFNRVTRSLRQPGSAMKPIVYLAAFRAGGFTLDTLVPDEPISVPDGRANLRKWIANYDGRFKGPIPIRKALAESRNAVAIWITTQVGIDAVLRTSRSLGVVTPLKRYPTTALGASEVTLLELATAYRTIASGVLAAPFIIRRIVHQSASKAPEDGPRTAPTAAPVLNRALLLIQEGLRGVVRIPSGTGHALNSRAFPIAVMGKTGTTNEFRDALFVGSTYGVDGITIAVRIGFDDNRSLGPRETGGRVALPVFQELMLNVYREGLMGRAPSFPQQMEAHITRYVQGEAQPLAATAMPGLAAMGVLMPQRVSSPVGEGDGR